MDSYTAIQELSEEVFGHLCSLAVDKCNDKMEKRKAGCGGRAMRKRVLIKNFVAELMKARCEDYDESWDEPTSDSNSHYDDDPANISLSDTILSDDICVDFSEEELPKADLWISGDTNLEDNYSDYLSDTILNARDGDRLPSPEASFDALYDLLDSEKLTEGDKQGEIILPGFVHTVPYDSFAAYDLENTGSFDLTELSYSSLSDVMDPLPLQPVRAQESDKLFLSLNNQSYSEMKTFTPLCDSSESLDDPILTDLDSGKENHFCRKRKSEGPLLSDGMLREGKRPKL